MNLAPRHTEMEISKIQVAEPQYRCVKVLMKSVMMSDFPSSWQIITVFLLNDYTQSGPIRW